MAIDINKLNNPTSARVRTQNTPQQTSVASDNKASTAVATQKQDSVVITTQAQQLQGMQTKMASLPDVDQKKIAEIKQAIAEGKYKVDPEKLAANIANFERELNELNRE